MPYMMKMALIFVGVYIFARIIRWLAVKTERIILHFYPSYCPELHLLGMPLPFGMKMIISNPRQRWARRLLAFAFIVAFVAVLYWAGAFD